ncbi:MAG TPA: hypothetical protein DCQ37_22645 [Desulfobacteraceae bacterium]|nr:hypothetical protein [Desulfobacteraceae bacterium]
MKDSARKSSYRERRRAAKADCYCCKASVPFCWQCRCGFSMCQDCMEKNFWGLSCNGITWECPDCGAQNGYGNQ